MKDWRILRPLWLISLCLAVPDPEALHTLTEAEYDTWLQGLHPPQRVTYDTAVARVKRQAGLNSYEFNSEETESGPWEEWGQPSACSRWIESRLKHIYFIFVSTQDMWRRRYDRGEAVWRL